MRGAYFFSSFKIEKIKIVICDFLPVSIKDQYGKIKYKLKSAEFVLRWFTSAVWLNGTPSVFLYSPLAFDLLIPFLILIFVNVDLWGYSANNILQLTIITH